MPHPHLPVGATSEPAPPSRKIPRTGSTTDSAEENLGMEGAPTTTKGEGHFDGPPV